MGFDIGIAKLSKLLRAAIIIVFLLISLSVLAIATPIDTLAQGRLDFRLQNGTPTATPVTDAKGQLLYRNNQALYTIMADGSAPTPVNLGTGFNSLCGVWSHDGRQIAVIGGATEFGLYIEPTSGGTPRSLIKALPTKDTKTSPVDTPIGLAAWAPDGKTIAYISQSGALYLLNVSDGKQKAKLTTIRFFSVDWSPDGKQFVAFGQDTTNKIGLFTLAIDGSALQPLVSLTDADLTLALSSDHFFNRDTVLPRWSPDGTQVSYAAWGDDGIAGVYIVSATNGANPKRVSDAKLSTYGASWSADGKYLAYTIDSGPQRAITITDLSQPRFGPIAEVTSGGCPVWKPGK